MVGLATSPENGAKGSCHCVNDMLPLLCLLAAGLDDCSHVTCRQETHTCTPFAFEIADTAACHAEWLACKR